MKKKVGRYRRKNVQAKQATKSRSREVGEAMSGGAEGKNRRRMLKTLAALALAVASTVDV
jgi:hypothetical protein